MKANLGDKVKVIDDGLLYSAYEEAAKVMGLKLWKAYKYDLSRDKTYLVLNDFQHDRSGKRLLGITDGTSDYIIREDGVKVVELGTILETTQPEKTVEVQFFDINNLSL